MNLTENKIAALEVTGKTHIVWDEKQRGLGVRVAGGGTKAYIWQGRIGGRERKATLGRFGELSLAEARAMAAKHWLDAQAGTDPTIERAARLSNPALKEVAARYFEAREGKRSVRNERLTAERHILPALGMRQVDDIDRDSVEKLHRKIAAKTPVMANRVIASLRGMLNFAAKRNWLSGPNPASGIEFSDEGRRDNPFTNEKLLRISDALKTWDDQQFADFFRLLLLTGCRPKELQGSRFNDWAIDGNRLTWTRPAATVKTKRDLVVPVSSDAAEIVRRLRDQHGEGSEWLFPSEGADGGHRVTFQKAWIKFRDHLGLTGHVLYDCRHTFASLLASKGGGSLGLVGALMGHTKVQTTARYAKYFDEDQRALTDQMGGLLKGAI